MSMRLKYETASETAPLTCTMHSSVQGYLAHKTQPPPLGPPYDPRYSPTEGPRRGVFLMIEVPL